MQIIINILQFLFKFMKFRSIANYIVQKIYIGPILAIEVILFQILIVYFISLIKVTLYIYEKINYLIKMINEFQSSNNDVLSLASNILKSVGLWNAFVDVWYLYLPMFLLFAVIYGSTIGINFFNFFRRRLYEYYHMARI